MIPGAHPLDLCVRCRKADAGETPWLCAGCFRDLSRQLFTFYHGRDPGMNVQDAWEAAWRDWAFIRRQWAWDSYERLEAGLVALPNDAPLLE